MPRTPPVWLLALTVLTLAGCRGDPGAGGSPPSTLAASSPTDNSLPFAGAPKVASPLPVSVLSGDPCVIALTAGQTKTIFGQVEQGERSDDVVLGPTCVWNNLDTGAGVSIFYDSTHDGLSSVYRGTKPRAIVWRETSIQGLPAAVHWTDLGGGSKDAFCTVSVGIADSASVDVGVTLSRAKVGKTDPCAVDLQIADMVIGNLKTKGRFVMGMFDRSSRHRSQIDNSRVATAAGFD